MKRKIGKHISTTTTILGLLVLTNAVAHADALNSPQFSRCVPRLYREGMSEQKAVVICQEILAVPRGYLPLNKQRFYSLPPVPPRVRNPPLDFGRTPRNLPPNLHFCDYNLIVERQEAQGNAFSSWRDSAMKEANENYQKCWDTRRK